MTPDPHATVRPWRTQARRLAPIALAAVLLPATMPVATASFTRRLGVAADVSVTVASPAEPSAAEQHTVPSPPPPVPQPTASEPVPTPSPGATAIPPVDLAPAPSAAPSPVPSPTGGRAPAPVPGPSDGGAISTPSEGDESPAAPVSPDEEAAATASDRTEPAGTPSPGNGGESLSGP
jgi:outer membrane biosynthesis protein TonB